MGKQFRFRLISTWKFSTHFWQANTNWNRYHPHPGGSDTSHLRCQFMSVSTILAWPLSLRWTIYVRPENKLQLLNKVSFAQNRHGQNHFV